MMPPRDPLSWPKGKVSLPNMGEALKRTDKRPYIGVTQGGSSRRHAGAKPAATTGARNAVKR